MSPPLLQAHPWHGLPAFKTAPDVVNAYIEIVPSDTAKYEIDKASGHLRLDRPQRFSNRCPAPYGFVPHTLCDERVAALARRITQRQVRRGDQDPLDICVLTEQEINHGGLLMSVRVIGGLAMIDGDEADDKIVAVLLDDPTFGEVRDIAEVPRGVLDRLRHYFLTYKQGPDELTANPRVEIAKVYDGRWALDVVQRSCEDYDRRFAAA
jgi:inorganic pyrophosphatase